MLEKNVVINVNQTFTEEECLLYVVDETSKRTHLSWKVNGGQIIVFESISDNDNYPANCLSFFNDFKEYFDSISDVDCIEEHIVKRSHEYNYAKSKYIEDRKIEVQAKKLAKEFIDEFPFLFKLYDSCRSSDVLEDVTDIRADMFLPSKNIEPNSNTFTIIKKCFVHEVVKSVVEELERQYQKEYDEWLKNEDPSIIQFAESVR